MNLPNNEVIWIRFKGENLENRAIPIDDLGLTLVAFQRILNKSYLAKQQKITKYARLSRHEQQDVSLQLTIHKKGSDAYGFTSFLSDPIVIDLLQEVVIQGLLAVGAYTFKRVFLKKGEKEYNVSEKEVSDQNEFTVNNDLIGSIYSDMRVLVRPVNGKGGVESIEISFPGVYKSRPVIINKSTKEYVKEIADEHILGEYQEFEGRVTKLHPSENVVIVLKKWTKQPVKVHLKPNDFLKIRYSEITESIFVAFYGRPVLRLGSNITKFDEFEANVVRIDGVPI